MVFSARNVFTLLLLHIGLVVSQNFYQILGVGKNASPSEIKKAYRTKSLQNHPDKNKAEGAAEKFAKINRAYEVLSDDTLRGIYNYEGEEGVEEYEQQASRQDHFHDDHHSNMHHKPRTNDIRFDYPVSLLDMYTGSTTTIEMVHQVLCSDWEMCVKVDRGCAEPGLRLVVHQMGGGFVQQFHSHDESCVAPGRQWVRGCRHCPSGLRYRKKEKVTLSIPKGARNHQQIRFSELGDELPYHDTGDIVLVLIQQPDDRFQRNNDDLYYRMHIPLVDALTNFTTTLTTVDGKQFEFSAEGVIDSGESRAIPNRGMPRLNGNGFGQMIVEFVVDFPEALSAHQQKLVREALLLQGSTHEEL